MNTKRDFIIGSMYGLSGMDVDHFETDRRQLPAVDSADEAVSIATDLAFGTSRYGLIDLNAVCKQTLRFVTNKGTSSIQSGVVLDQVLTLLPAGPAGILAVQLSHLLREDQLARIGRGGVLAMRDAAAAMHEAENRVAIERLDQELLRRGPIHFLEVGDTLILGDEMRLSAIDFAAARIRRTRTLPRAKVVVVYCYHPGVDHDLAIEHVRVQVRRSLDRRLWKRLEDVGRPNIFTLDERLLRGEFVGSVAHSFQSIAKAWVPRSWAHRRVTGGEAT